MIRWFIAIFLALLLIGWLTPLLRRVGLGRLPGDFRFIFRGREWSLPFASTVVLSLIAGTVSKLL